jgi:hypothetical protein
MSAPVVLAGLRRTSMILSVPTAGTPLNETKFAIIVSGWMGLYWKNRTVPTLLVASAFANRSALAIDGIGIGRDSGVPENR